MNLLTAQQLSKSYGPRTLFANIDLAMNEGEKIGVIGPNGCGKSTMLQILAGRIDADSGIVTMQKGATALYVDQDPTFPEGTTPTEAVAQIMGPLRETIAQWETITEQIATGSGDMARLLEEQATLGEAIERLGGWNWSHRVETYLERLGIRPDDRDRPLHTLSGGQRRRVALARALLAAPDLLMLDEPTNHLDADTLEWLEQTLAAYSGAMLLITHDRYFLDRVVTRIVEFDEQGLYSCPGAYSIFIERKLERERMRSKAESRRLKILSREMEWLSRGPKARTTKSKSRIDRAHELMDAAPQADNTRLNLNFNADNRLGGIILEVNGLAKSYDDLEVFKGLHLAVQRQDKIGIIGPNGCGKSTFLRVLLGQERPDEGKIRWGNKTRPGYLSQTRDELDPKDTVLEALSPNEMVRVGKRSVHKRGYLQEFLFDDGAQRKKVGALSGGERCRLLLAKLMLENANILILDEPTNDLDIVSLQLLEDALRSFQGCILMVTHDRYFLNKVCNVIAAFEDDHIERYDGDYDFYRTRRDAKANEERKAAAALRKEAERARDAERKATKPRKLTWAEKNELEGMETTILEAEERKEALEAKLADPALYRDHPTKVPGLNADLQTLTTEIETLYARWEALEALKP